MSRLRFRILIRDGASDSEIHGQVGDILMYPSPKAEAVLLGTSQSLNLYDSRLANLLEAGAFATWDIAQHPLVRGFVPS